MQVTNITSRALEIAETGHVVDPGDSVDVPDDVGKALTQQTDVWQGESKSRRAKAGDEDKEQ